ncbi:MAG TPA: hypothetical protein VF646_05830, partial [Cytophagales bacterium]
MRKIILALACTACGLSAPLYAQQTTSNPKTVSIPAKMTITPDFKRRLVDFLHQSFPESRSVPATQLNQRLDKVLRKAVGYGLDNEADLATYVITAYVLGEDFDVEVTEAGQILRNPRYTSNQKAQQLESWTRQVMQALEEDDSLAREVSARQTHLQHAEAASPGGATDASPDEYLTMQAD